MRANGPNDRLRAAMTDAGMTIEALAEAVGHHPKQVGRWVGEGVIPRRPGTMATVAKVLDRDQAEIWPAITYAQSELGLVGVHRHRSDLPAGRWRDLIEAAVDRVDVLVYAGLFLPELLPDLAKLLERKADAGMRPRFLLGDPAGDRITQRGAEEGIGGAVAAKIHNVLTFYRPLAERSVIDLRFHDTTLYNSIYRFDDEMIVSAHIYGAPAAHAPVLQIRRGQTSDLYHTYETVFERIWADSKEP